MVLHAYRDSGNLPCGQTITSSLVELTAGLVNIPLISGIAPQQ